MRSSEAERALFELAHEQGGYFTAKQAAHLGYTASNLPPPERLDLLKWWLWSRGRDGQTRGVFSHLTALSLHELTDVSPATIDLAVPMTFRKGTPIPPVVSLRFEDIADRQRESIHGVPVTKALRTILDVWPTGAVPTATETGFRRVAPSGKITARELMKARKERQATPILMQLERGNA